ncbi:MAG: 4-alpha-glucanotransferase [Actinomycetota bacterium]
MDRGSGILMHITSLPSAYGTGDFGKPAYLFADYLSRCRQKYWQLLPLNPTSRDSCHSPYSTSSVFALNPLFIDLENLSCRGLLSEKQAESWPDTDSADYRKAGSIKGKKIDKAFSAFSISADSSFKDFCSRNSWWLDDYCLFVTIKSKICSQPWTGWPRDLRDRHQDALDDIRGTYSRDIQREKFTQYMLFTQWESLKNYCNRKGIKIIGDLPIYPCLDSAEVWANPGIFKLGGDKKPLFLAGVPPDYFSENGQLWGNPVYDWNQLKASGYRWWVRRLWMNFKLFDLTRIDHFRGLVAYWEVPYGQENAVGGKWVNASPYDFLDTMTARFGKLPVIAEDLGLITEDVKEVLKKYRLPTMKVLLFAFTEDNHPYMPHNYSRNCFVYTGTHDNDTAAGWFSDKATEEEKARLGRYTGKTITAGNVSWELIRLAMASVADTSIIPMQDILGLGNQARMNLPSTTGNNWKWRLKASYLNDASIPDKLSDFVRIYGRDNP